MAQPRRRLREAGGGDPFADGVSGVRLDGGRDVGGRTMDEAGHVAQRDAGDRVFLNVFEGAVRSGSPGRRDGPFRHWRAQPLRGARAEALSRARGLRARCGQLLQRGPGTVGSPGGVGPGPPAPPAHHPGERGRTGPSGAGSRRGRDTKRKSRPSSGLWLPPHGPGGARPRARPPGLRPPRSPCSRTRARSHRRRRNLIRARCG